MPAGPIQRLRNLGRALRIWRAVLLLVVWLWWDSRAFSYPGGVTEARKAQRQRRRARWLTGQLLGFGSAFIKLGQLLATRSDILGDAVAQDLARRLADDPAVRVVVLRSANPEFFIAHFDVTLIQHLPTDAGTPESLNDFHAMCEAFRTMPKATIAVIEGRVGGGGSELALSCDMRFAALGKAVFAQPEVALGILPGGSGTQRLPRLCGRGRALEVVLGCEDIPADLAERYGISSQVWSVTSFSELQRDGLACEAPAGDAPHGAAQPWITQCLAIPQARAADKASAAKSATAPIPTIAATDYVRALPELVRAWVPGPYITLGTDGYGRSDTRAALRAHFRVDAAAIAAAARSALQLTPHPSGSAPA